MPLELARQAVGRTSLRRWEQAELLNLLAPDHNQQQNPVPPSIVIVEWHQVYLLLRIISQLRMLS
ncbi:MAG: hypothetical protein CVU90_09690 [Firmicutes bacterium HGW-Firmicutes-15]|nr:MAG: hypothetical protein CVU90_09690 [Firmicutes bacterium HGW-Firmicutes-15]